MEQNKCLNYVPGTAGFMVFVVPRKDFQIKIIYVICSFHRTMQTGFFKASGEVIFVEMRL